MQMNYIIMINMNQKSKFSNHENSISILKLENYLNQMVQRRSEQKTSVPDIDGVISLQNFGKKKAEVQQCLSSLSPLKTKVVAFRRVVKSDEKILLSINHAPKSNIQQYDVMNNKSIAVKYNSMVGLGGGIQIIPMRNKIYMRAQQFVQ